VTRRSDQRRDAVFALYQRDAKAFTRELAHATARRTVELDDHIARHAQGWSLDRIAPLERNLMRVALQEMLHPEEVPAETAIPPEGAIDEAIEIAKRYCGADAPGFVNGILDAVLREVRA
jgi:transcription antitermination protein NusB